MELGKYSDFEEIFIEKKISEWRLDQSQQTAMQSMKLKPKPIL